MTPILIFAAYACPTAALVWANHRCTVANRPSHVFTDANGSPVRVLAVAGEPLNSHGALHYASAVHAAPVNIARNFGR